MPHVSGYKIVCAGGVGTFDKNVVVWVWCYRKSILRLNMPCATSNELLETAAVGFGNLKLRPGQHGFVLQGSLEKRTTSQASTLPTPKPFAECCRASMPPTPQYWCRGRDGATALSAALLPASALDNLINLAGSQLAGTLPPGFPAQHLQHLGLWGRQPDVVSQAQQNGFGRAPLFDHQRLLFVFHPPQQGAESVSGGQRRNDISVGFTRGSCHISTVRAFELCS